MSCLTQMSYAVPRLFRVQRHLVLCSVSFCSHTRLRPVTLSSQVLHSACAAPSSLGRNTTDMDEAKSRELAEWIQEGAISQVRESQEIPESKLVSMHWVLTWKSSDEHPQGRNAIARIVVLGYQHPEVAEKKV